MTLSPVAIACQAIDRDGSFLDVGCANGHLLESMAAWIRREPEPPG
jgi:2-polyprenyl-3-methyl-5-hydroxy-6-metoxy-1,4-benzoquinol methylase